MTIKSKYTRTLHHRYYILYKDQDEAGECQKAVGSMSLKEQMLINNRINDLLPVRVELVNNEKLYYYDVGDRQPLSVVYDRKTMHSNAVCCVLSAVIRALESCRNFFLDEDDFVISQDAIFVNAEGENVGLVHLPGYRKAVRQQLLELLEYFMNRLDYKDNRASFMTYSVYAHCRRENSTLEDLADVITNQPEEKGAIKKETEPQEGRNVSVGEAALPNDGEKAKRGSRKSKWRVILEKLRKHAAKQEKEQRNDYPVLPGIQPDACQKTEVLYNEAACGTSSGETVMMSFTDLSEAFCILRSIDAEVRIYEFPFYVGKLEQHMDYCLMKPEVSRFHARLTFRDNKILLADLNSANGTFVNGSRLAAGDELCLCDGDKISFAGYEYIIEMCARKAIEK